MKRPHRFLRLLATGIAVLGLAAPTAAWAAPPLPLPSATFYGQASGASGPLASGTVKVILPNGGAVSAPIAAIAGSGYNYSVSLPLGMPSSGTSLGDPSLAAIGDAVRFYVNGTLAVFHDQSGIARGSFTVPTGAIGRAYLLDLALVGPEAFPIGDVNASGFRDSADSLLVLRYDVGLTMGGQVFPPPPRTIYLPLCDIVQDGKCNSSDALRILQCDAGMPGVSCPTTVEAVTIAEPSAPLTGTALVALRTDYTSGPEPDQVTVRVLADDPLLMMGAASTDLEYSTPALSAAACAANPTADFDAAFCSADAVTGTVRMSAVAVQRTSPEPVLAAVTFRLADRAAAGPSLAEYLSRTITLTVRAVFDTEGEPLAWRTGGTGIRLTKSYLPVVTKGWAGTPSTEPPTVTPPPTPTATQMVSPTATFTPTSSPTLTPTIVPTATGTPTPTAPPTVTPSVPPSVTPSAAPTATLLPSPTPSPTATPSATAAPSATPAATPTEVATETPAPAATPTVTSTPPPAPSATPTAMPSSTPTPAPAATPTSTPTATPAPAGTVTPPGTPSTAAGRKMLSQAMVRA